MKAMRARLRKWTVFATTLALLAVALSGCWGRVELENQSLATVLGIDNGQGKRLRITARIAIPRVAAGGETGGSGGPLGGFPVTVEGNNMVDAIGALQQIAGRDVTMAHLTILVLGEEFARQDVGPAVDVFSRMLQFRPNTLVVTCRESAEEFVQQFTPGEETEPSVMIRKLIESTHIARGGSPFVTMQDFINAYATIGSDPWTPYMTLASASAEEKPTNSTDLGEGIGKEEIPEEGTGRGDGGEDGKGTGDIKLVRLIGSAVYSNVDDVQRMVGALDFHETTGANILAGDFSNTVIQMAFPESHEEVSVRCRHASIRRKVKIEANIAHVTWIIRMTAAIDEVMVHKTQESLGEEFEEDVVTTAEEELGALLNKTFLKLQSLRSDAIDLGKNVQMKFATYPEWEEYNWRERFPEAKATFDIRIHLVNSGFVYKHTYAR